MDDGVLGPQRDLADFPVAIHGVAALHLGCLKLFLPFNLQPAEPEFERLGSIDALGPVGLHQAKETTLETIAEPAQPLIRLICRLAQPSQIIKAIPATAELIKLAEVWSVWPGAPTKSAGG